MNFDYKHSAIFLIYFKINMKWWHCVAIALDTRRTLQQCYEGHCQGEEGAGHGQQTIPSWRVAQKPFGDGVNTGEESDYVCDSVINNINRCRPKRGGKHEQINRLAVQWRHSPATSSRDRQFLDPMHILLYQQYLILYTHYIKHIEENLMLKYNFHLYCFICISYGNVS